MANQWVIDCFKCNVADIFKEIAELVERDVKAREALNKQLNKKKKNSSKSLPKTFHTRWSKDELTKYVKFGVEGGNPDTLCSISLDDDHIAIEIPSKTGFRLEAKIWRRWDIEHAQCLLTISDREELIKRDDLWKIVQGFLKPLFFPEQ